MRGLATCVATCLIVGALLRLDYGQTAPVGHRLYDPDPTHLWNRVHDTFHVRVAPDGTEYGLDTVDPLMWRETRNLITGDSHARALRLLDEFLASNGERLIRDPLKHAVFQNDLWAVFDWLVKTSDGDSRAAIRSNSIPLSRPCSASVRWSGHPRWPIHITTVGPATSRSPSLERKPRPARPNGPSSRRCGRYNHDESWPDSTHQRPVGHLVRVQPLRLHRRAGTE